MRNLWAGAHQLILWIVVVLTLAAVAIPAYPQDAKYPPTIVFMTDFGTVDDAVPIC